MIKVTSRGSFGKTEAFLKRMQRREQFQVLHKYGAMGVRALRGATPVDSGLTADSWYYQIVSKPGYFAIHWYNSHIEQPGDFHVAIAMQYGHATGTGGRVEGIDYINPVMRPIFDQMAIDVWKEVTK